MTPMISWLILILLSSIPLLLSKDRDFLFSALVLSICCSKRITKGTAHHLLNLVSPSSWRSCSDFLSFAFPDVMSLQILILSSCYVGDRSMIKELQYLAAEVWTSWYCIMSRRYEAFTITSWKHQFFGTQIIGVFRFRRRTEKLRKSECGRTSFLCCRC